MCHSEWPNQEMMAAVYLNSSRGQWAGFQMCNSTSLQSINKRRKTVGMLTFVQKIAQRVKDMDDKSSCTSSCHAARVECLPSAASPPDEVKKKNKPKSLFSQPFCHEERYSKAEQIYVVEADLWRHIWIAVCSFLGVYVSRHSGAASAI